MVFVLISNSKFQDIQTVAFEAANTNSEFQASMPTSKRGLKRRSTLRALAKSLDVGISTLHRKFKLGLLRHHSITLKPHSKERNKRERLQFCISMLDQTSLGDAEPRFIDMQNIIHMDEKWYYMTKKARKYYLLQEEDDPERTIQNKNNIGKLMLLTVVGRPRRNAQGIVTFSGNIGV